MTMTKSAIVALRVSSSKQGLQGDSLDDQLVQVQRRAEQLGATILEGGVFTYSESASGDHQPLQEIIDYCHKHSGQVDYAIVMAIDRATRAGARYYTHLKTELLRYGTILIDTRGIINPTQVNTLEHLGVEYTWSKFNPTYISEILEAERAKDEVRTILTRMLGAEIRYTRLGYWRGEAPIGYSNTKQDTEHGRRIFMVENTCESGWIKRMFELRAQGTVTDEAIVEQINKRGFRSRRRRKLDPHDRTRVLKYMGEQPLTVKQLQRMIERPVYAGFMCEKWTNNELVACACNSLVSIDLWNAANRKKKSIVKIEGVYKLIDGEIPDWQKVKNFDNPSYPWRKYILCPLCRKPFLGSAARGKSGKQYPGYHCSRGHKYYRVSATKLGKTIVHFVSNVEFTLEFWAKFRQIVLQEWDNRMSAAIKDSLAEGSHVHGLKQEKEMLLEKLKVVTHNDAIRYLDQKIKEISIQIAKAIAERNEVELKELDIQAMINRIYYFMEHLEDLILKGDNNAQNAEMFGLLFDVTPTYEELVNGTPKLCPIFRLNEAYKQGENQLVGCLSQEWNTLVDYWLKFERAIRKLNINYAYL